ncbi:MAG: chalcone isomerase family protein [Kiritimatiellia bacterium]
MKIASALALLLAFAVVSSASESLVLNGTGIRTKPILGAMYELSLSVPESLKGAEAKTLVESDQPMEFVLEIQSRLITRARFVETTSGGFAKAAQSGYASEKTQAFLDQFAAVEFKKGDSVVMRYADGRLATLYRKSADGSEAQLGTIADLGLKKALFAIWLGDVPAQESLKKALLGAP